jgi:hypothetical protein
MSSKPVSGQLPVGRQFIVDQHTSALVAVSLRLQQTANRFSPRILDAQYRSTQSRACFRDGLSLDATLQPRAAIHFESARRQGLLRSQNGH